jgi:hypothetical protein
VNQNTSVKEVEKNKPKALEDENSPIQTEWISHRQNRQNRK